MDNAIYVGLSRQMILQRELDIAANNLANVDTAGFKLEQMIEASDPVLTAPPRGKPQTVVFVASDGVARDFSQGPLTHTGSPLDVAVQGRGFFQIDTAAGPRYTRDGRFRLDATGKIVTQDGETVDGGGGPIVLDPKLGPVAIATNGDISQHGQNVGKLSVVTFDSLAALSKAGGNLYRNVSNLAPKAATSAEVRQGFLEGSNVQPVKQITRLIEINQAYNAITNMMSSASQLSTAAIQRLGAVNVS
ncbi:MAG: flagellar basal-body rod protein FlgF [Caulobacteraceae bacterium]